MKQQLFSAQVRPYRGFDRLESPLLCVLKGGAARRGAATKTDEMVRRVAGQFEERLLRR